MLNALRRRESLFPELSYANEQHSRVKRWFIRSVEGLSGRDRYARLYDTWRREIVPSGQNIFTRMLQLIDVGLDIDRAWPPADLPDTPLVIVANHPFGIGDGIAVLSLAERLGRPFKVMIHADLLRLPEMVPYALPIDFNETKAALQNNIAVRNEALRLLKEGVTIVVFPAGGVATAPKGLGTAEDLPWKMFPARLIQEAGASVLPVYFSGQNGRLFHIVSGPMNLDPSKGKLVRMAVNFSLTARLSLLVREFTKLSGKSIRAKIGDVISREELASMRDRKRLMEFLRARVLAMGSAEQDVGRRRLRGFRRRRQAIAQSVISPSGTASSSVASTSTS
jgi:putative hemolysin